MMNPTNTATNSASLNPTTTTRSRDMEESLIPSDTTEEKKEEMSLLAKFPLPPAFYLKPKPILDSPVLLGTASAVVHLLAVMGTAAFFVYSYLDRSAAVTTTFISLLDASNESTGCERAGSFTGTAEDRNILCNPNTLVDSEECSLKQRPFCCNSTSVLPAAVLDQKAN